MKNFRKRYLLSTIACITLSGAAYAGDKDNLMEASALLEGEVNNGLEVVGAINDVVIDEHSQSVDYVMFEVSEVFRPVQSDELLFATTSNFEFTPAMAAGEWQIVLEDTDGEMVPQEVAITEDEADYRLLSGILDNSVHFSEHEAREIEDVLISADTGEVAYYTVSLNSDNALNTDVHAIPASEIHIDMNGHITTSATLMEVGTESRYQLSTL